MKAPKTAAMRCTRYHRIGPSQASNTDPWLLPLLAPPEDRDAAASDWLAHVQAGRIAVR